ncbi:MAG: CRTAC1 family protein [Pseudobdellovibrio sp.]
MRHVCLVLTALAFSINSYSDTTENGIDFFKKITNETRAREFSPKDLPQNIGGTSSKMQNNETAALTKLYIDIAVSDEAVFQGVIQNIINPLQASMLNKDFNGLSVFKDNGTYSFDFKKSSETKSFDNITVTQWDAGKKAISSSELKQTFQKHFAQYKKIEFVEINPTSTATPISKRSPVTYAPFYFDVVASVDIRGLDLKNARREDRFQLNLSVEKNAVENKWIAQSLNLVSGETVLAPKASFQNVASFSDQAPANYLRREAIRRGGYAISMCDYDNDGNVDMFVGHREGFEVFKGDGKGHFKKVPNASLGLGDDTLVKSLVCNDFDNDGLKDLLVVRFAPSEQKGNDIILYHNTGGKFAKETTIKNRAPAYYAMPAAVADYNNDGLLDFYVGFPGAKDFTVLNKSANGFTGLKEAHPQGLFYNLGKFAFDEVTKEKIPYSKTKNAYNDGYPESAVVFPHTSMGIDYDLDGNMDIVVVDDKANLSPLYKNTGNGNFVQVADKIGVTNYDFGMGFTAADLDNDGHLEFIYTNVNFLPSERIHNSLVNNFSEYSKLPGTYGVRIFKTKDGKNYSDVTALAGIKNTGYGIGGVEVIDYDNDGNLDFYVPTGLWTGNTPNQDIASVFSRAYAKFDMDYEELMGSPKGYEQANSSFMKILTDFKGDITTGVANDKIRPSMAGFQRNRMFHNNGDGTFTEVGYALGVDSVNDGYIVATADLNHDGKMDLVLRNADPGTEENKFPSVEVYMNQTPTKNKSVILTLEGSRSNRDAVGAIVEAQIKNVKYTRHLIANNGAAQSQALVHFGLGKSAQIDSLKIRWPSGTVDLYKNIGPGYHHYKESTVSISALEK